jgi:ribosome maturation factor RimP
VTDDLQVIVNDELDTLDLDLVELRRGGSRSRPVVDVRIDRRDGQPVTVDDCARASRAIEARLDESRLAGERYVLEVSSPGVERPLRTAAEWRRFVGKPAIVSAVAVAGREAEVEIVGLEGESGSEVAVLRDQRGVEHRVELAAITQARLAFHWNR